MYSNKLTILKKDLVWLCSLGDGRKAAVFLALNWLIAVLDLHAGMCPVIESETAAPGSPDEDSHLVLHW